MQYTVVSGALGEEHMKNYQNKTRQEKKFNRRQEKNQKYLDTKEF